jgi:hypothetical protein
MEGRVERFDLNWARVGRLRDGARLLAKTRRRNQAGQSGRGCRRAVSFSRIIAEEWMAQYADSACAGIEAEQLTIESIDKLDEDSAGVTTEGEWRAIENVGADKLDRGRLGGGNRARHCECAWSPPTRWVCCCGEKREFATK